MADALPLIPAHRVEPYVQARIQAILTALIPRYHSHEVSMQELYGAIGAIAELHQLLRDIKEQQRKSEAFPRDGHGIVYERGG